MIPTCRAQLGSTPGNTNTQSSSNARYTWFPKFRYSTGGAAGFVICMEELQIILTTQPHNLSVFHFYFLILYRGPEAYNSHTGVSLSPIDCVHVFVLFGLILGATIHVLYEVWSISGKCFSNFDSGEMV